MPTPRCSPTYMNGINANTLLLSGRPFSEQHAEINSKNPEKSIFLLWHAYSILTTLHGLCICAAIPTVLSLTLAL